MEAKTISPHTKEVQRRFFEALDRLKEQDKIAGLQTFCTNYNLHKAKYSNIRSAIRKPEHDGRYKFIDIDALFYLVKDFGVSANWLLTGRGEMFSK